MRLWSIHPKYLDRIGLIALWREGLLAQKVLEGLTKGYVNHPQLLRFKRAFNPLLAIGTYLYHVYLEGVRRGYDFKAQKIREYDECLKAFIPITSGQVEYEFELLLYKLSIRGGRIDRPNAFDVNPVFYVVDGPIADWEKPKEQVLERRRSRPA